MTVARFMELFQQYGLALLFVIFFLEYMNLPGFPAGVMVSQSELSLVAAIAISLAAGVAGSFVIYILCYAGGAPIAHKLAMKHEKLRRFAERCQNYIEKYGNWGLVACRLIPVLRTIVSIPAGLLRVPPQKFVPWSALGILLWNSALISFGYAFSYLFIT